MKHYFLLFISVICFSSCSQKNEMPITELSQNTNIRGILVDVRSPEEYAEGHLPNALNINWYDDDFLQQLESLDKKKTLYLYCKKGGRSSKASELLQANGFKTVNLLGGYDSWQAAQ